MPVSIFNKNTYKETLDQFKMSSIIIFETTAEIFERNFDFI